MIAHCGPGPAQAGNLKIGIRGLGTRNPAVAPGADSKHHFIGLFHWGMGSGPTYGSPRATQVYYSLTSRSK